jgi:DNA-binding response OmpR family regulator
VNRSGSAVPTTTRSGRMAAEAPDAPVLLVGADQSWLGHLDRSLMAAGWASIVAVDIARARWLASIRRVSMVVIVGTAGFRRAALHEVRSLTDVPIVMVGSESDHGTSELLRNGADLVVSGDEPVDTVVARLEAVFRRADHRRVPGVRYLRARGLEVDLWSQGCTCHGVPVALSTTEYDLLTFLMTRPSVTLASSTIVRRVWDHPPDDGRNALRIVVARLRRKLGDHAAAPEFIESVRGSGYRFLPNVAEVADSLTDHAARVDVTPLLDSLTSFSMRLASAEGEVPAAEALLDVIELAGVADGAALFRTDGARMYLVAARNMPTGWMQRVADGVPLDPAFASAQSVLSGQVVQFADVRAVKAQFGATSRQLVSEGFRACHFVPIHHGVATHGSTWGHLGLAGRSPTPLDGVTMAYLRSLCAAFILHHELEQRRHVLTPTDRGRGIR